MQLRKKRKGLELQMKSLTGGKGNYLFFKTANGAYHAFLEVATKDAAFDCGAEPPRTRNTRQICKDLLGF